MRRLVLIALFLTACTRDRDAQCAPFVYDPATRACVCPPGSITIPEAGACELPDGGELRMDGAVALPDAGGDCVPTAELCNGLDDDCDGAIDGPAALASCGTRDHATGLACTAGECVVTTCADGFGNCDEDAENGCEAPLDTLDHCGSCGTACGWECEAGACDDAVQVDSSPGSGHTCILRESGRIACWGNNEFGELGLGDAGAGTDRAVPAHVIAPDGSGTFDGAVEIAVASDHTCARKGDGSVWCWGLNDARQLGDGTTTNRSRPVQASVSGAVSIAAGLWFSCAAQASGRVVCWGMNDRGQLGQGDLAVRTTPVEVLDIADAVRVEGHGWGMCALLRDGTLRCWGRDMHGILGVDFAPSMARPVTPIGIDGVVDFGLGRETACALRDDGTLWCWGSNYSEQISSRWDYAAHPVPRRVEGLPLLPAALRLAGIALIIDADGRVATLDAVVDPDGPPARDFIDAAHACIVHRRGSVRCAPTLAAHAPFVDLVAP